MPRSVLGFIAGLFLLMIFTIPGYSQSITQGYTDYQWYFGNSTFSVGFNKGFPNSPYLDSIMVTPFGQAGNGTANDQVTGALLFYTDGSTVYDASHRPMPGASGMPAVTANQGIAICPVPGNNDQYYIFAINGSGNLDYSIVNMSLPGNSIGAGNLGSVTTWRQALPGSMGTNVSQAMIIVPKSTLANGYWLITQEPNTAIYNVIDINPGGFAGETSTDFQGPGIVPITASHFALHSSGLLSVTAIGSNKNVQLYDFDASSGTLTFNQMVLNSNTFDPLSPEALYDSEFNPAGDLLFVSQHGSSTDAPGLLVYDYGNSSQSSRQIFPGTLFRSYGLKYAPDNKLYHLYQETSGGPFLIGRIENPDAPIDSLIYTERVFGVRDFGGKQFPSVLPPKVISPDIPSIVNIGSCTTDTVWFFPEMDPFTDQFTWDFSDNLFPGDQGAVAPGYNYQNPGSYSVTVTTSVSGTPTTSTPLILNIQQTQLEIDLGQDTVICPSDTLEIGIEDQTYNQLTNVIWSTGETNVKSILVTEGGNYWVSGVDASSGCVLHDAIAVDEYGVNVQISNIWYFGQNAGLDFNQQPPVPLDNSLMTAPEGCAAYSDRNGEILFYTDGRTVYSVVNDVHQQMPNGTNLSGDPGSAQSALIVQFPSDETLYYIFTTNCTNPLVACTTYQLSYSVVDLKAVPGGDVIIKNKPLFQYSTERITALSFGNSIVLLAHEFGTNTFRAYPITELGIGSPILSSVGSVHSQYDQIMGEGYMKFSTDGTKIAVALPYSGSNVIELFDFDAATGMVINPVSLDLGSASGQVYGIEFSPNSNWLYATLSNMNSGSNSSIYQWHVDSTTLAGNVTDPDYIINSRAQVPGGSTSSALGAIQLGPDSRMYVAVEGQAFLGVVNNPDGQQDGTSNAVADLTSGQPLVSGTASGLGLPNFIQNLSTQQPQPEIFLPPLACVGETIMFSATATSSIDKFSWSIFNSSGALVEASDLQGDTVTFNIPDDYIFTVRIYNRCLDPIALLTDTLTVSPLPLPTTGASAIPLCDQPATLMPYDSGPHPEYTYLWSTGETTQDITVSNIGNYNLTITTQAGCTLDYSVFVGPPFGVNLGPDQEICEGQALTLDSQANADDYIWELILGGTVFPISGFENSRFLPLDQITPALTPGAVNTIAVGVIDPINPGCIVRDTVDINVNADPVVIISSTDDTNCDPLVNDGTITISDHPTDDLDYIISGPATYTGLIVSGSGPITEIGLQGGIYTVDVQSNVTGCSTVSTIIVSEPTVFTITDSVTSPDDCDPALGAGLITIGLDMDIFPIDYVVTDPAGVSGPFSGTIAAADSGNFYFTIPDLLMAGTYNIDVTQQSTGCTGFVAGVIVEPTQPSDLQGPLQVTECNTSVDLSLYFTSLTPNATIEWSDDNGSNFSSIATPFSTLGQTSVLIRAGSPVTCDSILTVDVILTPTPTVSVDSVKDCSGFVTLSANVVEDFTGAQYTYQWFQGSQPTSISASQSVNVADNDFYWVSVSHSINLGCNFTTTPQSITVPIAFVTQLTSSPACTDKEFLVTASAISQGVLLPPDILSYRWFIDGVEQAGETSQQIQRENVPGQYSVEVRNEDNCSQTDQINIIINDPTPSDVLPVYTICFDEIGTLLVDPGGPFVSYAWYNINNPDNPILIATTSTYETDIAGSFRVDLTNGFQCVTGDAFNVIEDCEALIYGPNAIRPGSSIEENQVFFLETEYVLDFQIFIYSRWGELVFESGDKDFEWNGTLNGTLLPAGSYTYIVKYTKEFGGNGETLVQYGGVTIVR